MTLILKNLEKLLEPKHSNLDAKFWVQKLLLKKYFKKKLIIMLYTPALIFQTNYAQRRFK